VHRDQIKSVYGLAVDSDIELLALNPNSIDDFENLGLIGDFARERLREALEQDAND
jgi:hypothetical protein